MLGRLVENLDKNKMALKSYRLKGTLKKGKKKNKPIGDIVRAGTGAIIGVAFISTLAGIINK